MEYKEFEFKIKIEKEHLDSFGHVNNAKYLELYEAARWDLMNKNDYGLDKIQAHNKGPIVLDVHCRYKRELINGEVITILSKPTEHKQKIMRMNQVMLKENGEIASDADFTFGFMDLELRKLIYPTDEWLRAVGLIV